MTSDLISLAVICLVSAACPIIAHAIPKKPIPEVVFLLVAGALLGPHMAGVVQVSDSVGLISDLGLSFLFLLAGYEIDPKVITGREGKRGLATWAVSFVIGFGVVALLLGRMEELGHNADPITYFALAIALTTTALGTLMPILKERDLMGTAMGNSVLAYGTWGELAPVLAMALLLSSRASWQTALILVAFGALAVVMAIVPAKARAAGAVIVTFLQDKRDTASQPLVRWVVFLVIALVAVSALADLDIVLGAFAAGFVLRYIIPEGSEKLEYKLEAMAYGFFVPLFFVVSGANIDLTAVAASPRLLLGFVVVLLLVRALPIHISMSLDPQNNFSPAGRASVALYCTTALPLIVAVTSVAVNAGALAQSTASVLVCSGAITVFLMPLLASVASGVAGFAPVQAAREIAANPSDLRGIVADHVALERMVAHRRKMEDRAHQRSEHAHQLQEQWEERHCERVRRAQEANAAHAEEVARLFAKIQEGHREEMSPQDWVDALSEAQASKEAKRPDQQPRP
ncbi:MAG: cation:proton antiporter [Eggerthellales bacterium]|nr:cation:proton antiporter [Eggerthellales bacterium]